MIRHPTAVALALIAAAPTSAPPAARLTIEASDYSFRAPRQVTAGWTTIRLRNRGPGFHHVVFLRLEPGESRDSVLARVTRRRGDPDVGIAGTVSIGGPEGRMPTGDSFATINLTPGQYLIVCTIPLKDGSPHAAKGMWAPLTVVPATSMRTRSQRPAADVNVRLTDYAYTISRDTLRAGWRVFRVENAGPAEHIAEIARLRDGRTAADMLEWADRNFAPSAEPKTTIAGSSRLSVGEVSYVRVELRPGITSSSACWMIGAIANTSSSAC